jgi:hypothetical protein
MTQTTAPLTADEAAERIGVLQTFLLGALAELGQPEDTLPYFQLVRIAERIGVNVAPQMHIVPGPVAGDPGNESEETLRCPHPACGSTSGQVIVVDAGERENTFSYEAEMVDEWIPSHVVQDLGKPARRVEAKRTGNKVLARSIVGGYGGGADMETLLYACADCQLVVSLPDDVEEVGD